jgi:NAD(P)-dependent dehydrogenase (short-subunit alcohol dehydrogenase family)
VPKYIVVTGAGTGIGRAVVEHLAGRKHAILLLGRNIDRLEETRAGLAQPESHASFACDIRQPEQIHLALSQSRVESVYGVVANAGVGVDNHYGAGDRWQDIIDTNLTGTYNTVQECLPLLRRDSGPYKKILIMSSILARVGVPAYSGYCASKAGLLGLMRSLAVELAPEKILVNAICPSWVDTQMTHDVVDGMAHAFGVTYDEAMGRVMTQVPLRKLATPQEVAELAGFLMAEEQRSVTGQAVHINNGALMI